MCVGVTMGLALIIFWCSEKNRGEKKTKIIIDVKMSEHQNISLKIKYGKNVTISTFLEFSILVEPVL